MTATKPEPGQPGQPGQPPAGSVGGTGGTGGRGGRGAQGQAGPLTRSVRLSFLAVVAVALLVISLMYWQFARTRALTQQNRTTLARVETITQQNRQLIQTVSELQKAKNMAAASTALLLCTGLESVKTTLRQATLNGKRSLTHIAYYRDHPDEFDVAVKAADAQLALFAARNCSSLPVVK